MQSGIKQRRVNKNLLAHEKKRTYLCDNVADLGVCGEGKRGEAA